MWSQSKRNLNWRLKMYTLIRQMLTRTRICAINKPLSASLSISKWRRVKVSLSLMTPFITILTISSAHCPTTKTWSESSPTLTLAITTSSNRNWRLSEMQIIKSSLSRMKMACEESTLRFWRPASSSSLSISNPMQTCSKPSAAVRVATKSSHLAFL